MKNIVIAGNIGRDAITRTTQGADKVTGFPVAVEERQGQDKRTIWFDCTLWGKRGESLAGYLTKGSRVSVAGDLSTREHEGKTYLTIRVSEVTLLGGGNAGGTREAQREEPRREQSATQSRADLDDEIPF